MSRSSGQGQGHRGKQTGFTSITSLKYTLVDGGGPTLNLEDNLVLLN